ncbi:amino acid transporter [Lophiotrema nucula]|uniref:Amino acid transporter n=1 Tax=Lophiotrema nucula TaxID=690887 RepID=A0A6A5ZU68_9PLEO|nr:amino acid transporter [Lophiotrema nucula]
MRQTMRDGPPVQRGMQPSRTPSFSPTESKPSYGSVMRNGDHHDGTSRDIEKDQSTPIAAYRRKSRDAKWAHKEDPFGDEEGAEVKYRTMRWWQAAFIMIAETISLGILSLPSALAAVGMVPGIIMIAGLGAVATYTGFVLGQFKLAYPHVHNIADAGEVLLGPIGREIGGAAQTIFLIFIMGSHILTFTIAMNAITGHATCSIVWGVIGFVVLWVFTLPRTLKKVSYLSIASFISICGAVFITMIGVGVDPAPNLHLDATVSTSLAPAFLSVTNIIFAYAGHVAFFSFISEFRDPTEFPKALYLLQATDTTMYLVVAIVVYRYTGDSVSSPALSSTSVTVMKIAYGIALPTILLAGVIYGHVAAKYIYVRIFRGTQHMSKRTLLSIGSWAGITFLLWLIAWIIAESIPSFNNLLALISALFASWFTYGLSGIFWLHLNWGQYGKNWKKICLTGLNVCIFGIGAAVCGIGLYASGKAIHDEKGGGSWSCADTST